MAKLVTAREIEAAAASGQRQVSFETGAIVTPAAKDRARELGIIIVGGANGHSANGKAVAAPARPAGQFVPVQTAPAPAAPAAPPKEFPGFNDKPTYFENVVLDNLMNISLELGAALWVVKERLRVIEELLSQRGVITSEMVELYRPDPAKERELRGKRDAFIEKIYKSVIENPG